MPSSKAILMPCVDGALGNAHALKLSNRSRGELLDTIKMLAFRKVCLELFNIVVYIDVKRSNS